MNFRNSASLEKITDEFFIKSTISKVDVAIVFGTQRHNELFAGVIIDLYKKGIFDKIILTGGAKLDNSICESKYLKELLDEKVGALSIFTDEVSTNTKENIVYAKSVLDSQNFFSRNPDPSYLFICKNYAARRCLLTIEKYLINGTFFFYTINPFETDEKKWFKDREFKKKVFLEIGKIKEYFNIDLLNYLNKSL